jgi:hypothetical protein
MVGVSVSMTGLACCERAPLTVGAALEFAQGLLDHITEMTAWAG